MLGSTFEFQTWSLRKRPRDVLSSFPCRVRGTGEYNYLELQKANTIWAAWVEGYASFFVGEDLALTRSSLLDLSAVGGPWIREPYIVIVRAAISNVLILLC